MSRAAVTLMAMALAACGGGDEDGDAQTAGETPPPSSGGQPPPSGGDNGDPNTAPTISGSPAPQVLYGNAYSFTPNAADADGDDLTFSVVNLPDWASFDTSTGRLTGTPDDGDLGSYPQIQIRVSDGEATAALQSFSIEVVATATGSATLSWEAPSSKTDGTPVDIAGFVVYWGTESGQYSNSEEIEGQQTYVIDQLTPATWYFAVTAVDSQGLESDFSNEATKQIL